MVPYVILTSICVLAFMWIVLGYIIFNFALKSRKKNTALKKESIIERNTEDYNIEAYNNIIISTRDDSINLNGYYSLSGNSKNWVICLHGYAGRSSLMLKYTEGFKKLGMNVLAVDLRGHGDSSSKYYTLGVKDSEDMLSWIEWIRSEFEVEKLFLFGISMGGATSLMTGGKYRNCCTGIMSDSAPTDFIKMFERVLRHRMGAISSIFLPLIKVYTKCFAKYDLDKAAAVKYIDKIEVPVLLIHGVDDGFVPVEMAKELYDKCKKCQSKGILLIKDAEHTHAVDVQPSEYWTEIKEFLGENI